MTTATRLDDNPPARPQPRTSFEEMILPYLPVLRRMANARVQNWHDAEDVVQQTLVLAFRHIGQFRFESSLGTWLCRIAINVIRGRLRGPGLWRTVSTDTKTMEALPLHDRSPSALAMLERQELSRRLRGAIYRLPEIYRVVVELRDLRGLSIRETAESLSLSIPAVKSRHYRARFLLSDILRKQIGRPDIERAPLQRDSHRSV